MERPRQEPMSPTTMRRASAIDSLMWTAAQSLIASTTTMVPLTAAVALSAGVDAISDLDPSFMYTSEYSETLASNKEMFVQHKESLKYKDMLENDQKRFEMFEESQRRFKKFTKSFESAKRSVRSRVSEAIVVAQSRDDSGQAGSMTNRELESE